MDKYTRDIAAFLAGDKTPLLTSLERASIGSVIHYMRSLQRMRRQLEIADLMISNRRANLGMPKEPVERDVFGRVRLHLEVPPRRR